MKFWIAATLGLLAGLALLVWPDSLTGLRALDIPILGTGYRAKELCTCLFVLEQALEDCQASTDEISLHAAFDVDSAQRSVQSHYLWLGRSRPLFSSVARFQDEQRGCLLLR